MKPGRCIDSGERPGKRQPRRAEIDVQPVDGDRAVRATEAPVEHERPDVVTMSAESREAQGPLRAADGETCVFHLAIGVGRRFETTLERYRDAGRVG